MGVEPAAAVEGDANVEAAAAVEPAEAVNVNVPPDSEQLICAICRQALMGAENPQYSPLALQCGHTFHTLCLENTWRIGNHQPGWCPFRCDMRQLAVMAGNLLNNGGNQAPQNQAGAPDNAGAAAAAAADTSGAPDNAVVVVPDNAVEADNAGAPDNAAPVIDL